MAENTGNTLTRRALLQGAAGVALGGLVGNTGNRPAPHEGGIPGSGVTNPDGDHSLGAGSRYDDKADNPQVLREVETAENQRFTRPFENEKLNEIAERLGITAGDFLYPRGELMGTLTAFHATDRLSPLLPVTVLEHRKLIFELSDETHFPPMTIAQLMTMESMGDPRAGSSEGAVGLFQVIPDNFKGGETRAQRYDPRTNGRAGLTYFQQCLDKSREYLITEQQVLSPEERNRIDLWGRAYAGYNGGQWITKEDEHATPEQQREKGKPYWTTESKIYRDHVIRRAIETQFVEELRKENYSDKEIVALFAQGFDDIKARAFAMRSFAMETNYSYKELEAVMKELSLPVPGSGHPEVPAELAAKLGAYYKEYFTAKENGQLNILYSLPSPATILWQAVSSHDNLLRYRNNKNLRSHVYLNPHAGRDDASEFGSDGPEGTIPFEYIYDETDPKWWDGVKADEWSTCGPTSAAMVVSTLLGRRVTPDEMDALFRANDIRDHGGDTFFRALRRKEDETFEVVYGAEGGVPQLLRDTYGLRVDQLFDIISTEAGKRSMRGQLEAFADAIDNGALIIASASHAKFLNKDEDGLDLEPKSTFSQKGADHIFVIEKMDIKNKKMTVVDPWGGVRKVVPIADMMDNGPLYAYAVKKAA